MPHLSDETNSLAFPVTAAELTPQWLDRILSDAGELEAGSIRDLAVESIGVGEGFLAQLARVKLIGDAELSPASLIAKFASPDDSTREFARTQNAYGREIGFYRDIGDDAGVPVPRCYYATLDPASNRFVALLEDLSPAQASDQVKGTGVDESRQVVEAFARVHARWWNSERLADYDWSKPVIDEQPLSDGLAMIQASIAKAETEGSFDRYPEMKAHLRRLPALFRLTPPRPFPFTLVHGDLRSDNVFFPTGAGGRFAVIDWQMCGVDQAARDLARWLVQSITTEQRRATEQELLAHYHAQLVANGVEGYSLGRLKTDYQLSIVVMYLMFAMGLDQIDTSAERSKALFHEMYSRLDAALVDWKVGRLLKVLPAMVPFLKAGAWLQAKFSRKGGD